MKNLKLHLMLLEQFGQREGDEATAHDPASFTELLEAICDPRRPDIEARVAGAELVGRLNRFLALNNDARQSEEAKGQAGATSDQRGRDIKLAALMEEIGNLRQLVAGGDAAGEETEAIDSADAKSAWEKVSLPELVAWVHDLVVIAVFLFDPSIPHDERPPLPLMKKCATRMRDARKERERAAGHPILPSPYEFAILELLPTRKFAMGTR